MFSHAYCFLLIFIAKHRSTTTSTTTTTTTTATSTTTTPVPLPAKTTVTINAVLAKQCDTISSAIKTGFESALKTTTPLKDVVDDIEDIATSCTDVPGRRSIRGAHIHVRGRRAESAQLASDVTFKATADLVKVDAAIANVESTVKDGGMAVPFTVDGEDLVATVNTAPRVDLRSCTIYSSGNARGLRMSSGSGTASTEDGCTDLATTIGAVYQGRTACVGETCAPLGCYVWSTDLRVYWNNVKAGPCTAERTCLNEGPYIAVGQGHCRESDCSSCANPFAGAQSMCVESLVDCQANCDALSGTCKGIAYAQFPADADNGCQTAGKARCMLYTGAKDDLKVVSGTRADSFQEYTCYKAAGDTGQGGSGHGCSGDSLWQFTTINSNEAADQAACATKCFENAQCVYWSIHTTKGINVCCVW